MDSDEAAKPEWVQTIEREHATIRTLVRALQTRVAAARPMPEWARAVADTLSALVPVLQRHFSHEDDELSPLRLARSSPELAARFADLNLEHASIVASFIRARQACIERGGDLELPIELRPELESAVERLEQHEQIETELLSDRWWGLRERG